MLVQRTLPITHVRCAYIYILVYREHIEIFTYSNIMHMWMPVFSLPSVWYLCRAWHSCGRLTSKVNQMWVLSPDVLYNKWPACTIYLHDKHIYLLPGLLTLIEINILQQGLWRCCCKHAARFVASLLLTCKLDVAASLPENLRQCCRNK